MKNTVSVLLLVYWAAFGYLPFALHSYARQYSRAIGCPEIADCYARGVEHLLEFSNLVAVASMLLWPLACIKLYCGIQDLFSRFSA